MRRWGIVALLVLVCVGTIGGLAQVRIDTGIDSFLPAGDPALRSLEEKARSFGGDPVIVLVESRKPRELLLDQEKLIHLLRLEGSLSHLPDVAAVYGPATVLNQTAGSAQNMLAQISGRRDALQNAAEANAERAGQDAAAAGRMAVAQFDRRYGSLLVRGLPAGLPTLRNPQFVSTVLYGPDGKPRPQWHFVVPTDHTVALVVRPREGLDQDAAGRLSSRVRQAVDRAGLGATKVTVTGVPVITSALTEQARVEAPMLGVAAIVVVGAVFLLARWSRRRRSRIRPPVCALLGTAVVLAGFGWLDQPVSLGVVAFLPILLGIGSDFPFYLSQPRGRRRAVVAALAATVGFASLAVSPLPFVRELGIALAAGIACTTTVALLFRRLWGVVSPPDVTPEATAAIISRRSLWQRAAALAGAAAVAAGGWALLPKLDIEARPDQLARGLPELSQAKDVERLLGSAGEVSIVLHGDVLSPAAFRWARQTEDWVIRRHGDQLRPVVTVANLLRFLGGKPTDEQIRAGMDLLPRYLTSSVVHRDGKSALMVFGVELHDLAQQRELLRSLRMDLTVPPPGLRTEVVGLPVAAVRGLDLVSDSRVLVNVVGIVAAGLVLAVGLRRRADVGRALLTVLLATGWVIALAWVIAGALSPLTVAIGSLITATGSEFAVMLSGRGQDVRKLRRGVGTAALAGTLGYLMLGLSGLAVLRDFGLLLAAGVVGSFAAALLVVWALPPAPQEQPRPSPVPRRKEVPV